MNNTNTHPQQFVFVLRTELPNNANNASLVKRADKINAYRFNLELLDLPSSATAELVDSTVTITYTGDFSIINDAINDCWGVLEYDVVEECKIQQIENSHRIEADYQAVLKHNRSQRAGFITKFS